MGAATILYYFCAGYTALVVFLYMISPLVRPAAFAARCLASYVCFAAGALFGLVTVPVLRLFGLEGLSQWLTGRFFVCVMAATVGVRFDIQDPNRVLERVRPVVFIGNHQTELDVLMLGAMFPPYCSVTAKAQLRSFPILGWWMAASGSIFIDRKNSKDAREAMRGAAAEITRRKQSVYMFPEGTRSYAADPVLLPFKKGAFHLAVEAGVPIVPCVIANYSHILCTTRYLFNSGSIPVKIMDPISTAGLTTADVDELTRTTREAMLEELVSLSAKAKGQPVPVSEDKHASATASGIDTTVESL